MRALILLLLLIGQIGPAFAAALTGVVRLGGEGEGFAAVTDAVLTWVPDDPSLREAPPVPDEPFQLVTEDKEFHPRILVVPLGSRVRFPNRDPILHNVFSVSGKNAFDVGLYRRGEGQMTTFDHPGLVRVFCNVHHSMVAYVFVADTRWVTRPDRSGRFELNDLPPGTGTLSAWHERTEMLQLPMEVPHGEPVEISLEVTKPRVPKHLNKLGKPYRGRYR